MPKQTQLTPMAPWVEIKTTPADWKKADPALLGAMLSQLHIIRAFEEKVLELAGEGLVHGPAHSSIGQEGGAVGSIIGLRPTDQVNGSHRGHHQFLAKALTYLAPGLTPMSELDDPLNDMRWPRSWGLSRVTATGAAARCICAGPMPVRWAPMRLSAAVCLWQRVRRWPTSMRAPMMWP